MAIFDTFLKALPFIFIGYFAVLSLAAFLAMGLDKARARGGRRRIPEKTLFFLALLGGSPGGILGIYAFRHKTLHRRFTLGFPLILALQLALFIFLLFGTD